ncbi:MAG TPA: hypothetical protein VIT45_11425 [Allosphingosinicella sp.]
MSDSDRAFDIFLAEALAPPEGSADRAFVARVDRAVLADELYRRQRKALWRRFGGETLAIAAVGASLATIASIPDLGELLGEASPLALPALLALPLLLFWILVAKGRPTFA